MKPVFSFLTGLVLLSMLLQGCAGTLPLAESAPGKSVAIPSSQTSTATLIPTVADTPTVSSTNTATPIETRTTPPTNTPQVATEPGQVAKQVCIIPISTLPEEKINSGKLFLSGPSKLNDTWWLDSIKSFFDLKNHRMTTVPQGKIASISVSPDHTKYVAVDATDHRMKVFSNKGQLLKTLPKGKFPYAIDGWLDNEHIALVVQEQEMPHYMRYPREVVIANPFTNEQTEPSSMYPDIDVALNITWEGVSTTKYDPQMTRVVYAAIIENDYQGKKGKGYILWDMEKQEKLVQIVTEEFQDTPKWSPDGSKFVFNTSYGDGEFYIVSRDGAITKLPILDPVDQLAGGQHSEVYSWSPDGQYLAFWREYYQDGNKATFAVLNTVTREVTDYCISAGYLEENMNMLSAAYLPVWSPDGKSIAVIANGQKEGSFDTLLIDLEAKFAAKIGDNMIPVGWLASAPQ